MTITTHIATSLPSSSLSSQQQSLLRIILSQNKFEMVSTVEEGLDFMQSHFAHQPSIWSRRISTHTTQGRQIQVRNKEEALARFKQANLLDCRISAYPVYTPEYYEHGKIAPDLLFLADLDLKQFESKDELDQMLGTNSRKHQEDLSSR